MKCGNNLQKKGYQPVASLFIVLLMADSLSAGQTSELNVAKIIRFHGHQVVGTRLNARLVHLGSW